MTRCPGNGRHWFTIRGQVGMRSPVCVRCGTPNPRPLTDDEWADLDQYQTVHGRVGSYALAALRRHRAAQAGATA